LKKRDDSERRKAKVGPQIVRAWFDTVINPLLSWLGREQELLAAKNWTWRFKPAGLEAIRHLIAYVDARPNWEQFEQLYPDMARIAGVHDRKVEALAQECERLHRALAANADYLDLFGRITSAESLRELGQDRQDVFGAYPESDWPDLIAEYIVNSTPELPSYYTTARLWNRYREQLLALLGRQPLRGHCDAVRKTGEELRRTTGKLRLVLQNIRLDLSLTHDVPYVPGGQEARGA
jgi:hypothetical protein